MKLGCWFFVLPLLATGCFSLDPFLYDPQRSDQYLLDPKGATPEETVTADRIELVRITVNDQVSLGAAYVKGNLQPPRGYAIFFHGKGGNLDSALPRTKQWANLGYDMLVFDYRGWGTSTDVTPTEAGILEDTRAARAWMRQRVGPANAERIIYYGQSLGTAISTQLAEQEPPAVLVLESAFASIRDFETNSTGMDFPVGFIAKASWATVDRIHNVHVPLLLVHGLDDHVVYSDFSKRIYANANEPKQLALIEAADHSNIPQTMGGQAYADLMNGFIGTYLR